MSLFCSGASHLENCVFASRFGVSLLSFVRSLLLSCPPALSVIHKDCARYAVSVVRQLLSDSSWQRAGKVAHAVTLAEQGDLSAMLMEGPKEQLKKKHQKGRGAKRGHGKGFAEGGDHCRVAALTAT